MDEKTRQTVDKMKNTMTAIAETQSTLAIGKAVVALVERGQVVSVESIINYLQADTAANPVLLVRAQNEAAERELLVAQQKSQS